MKDLSFFLLKDYLAAKMRKRFRNFCNGDGSTSTLHQQQRQQHKEEAANPDDRPCCYVSSSTNSTSPCYYNIMHNTNHNDDISTGASDRTGISPPQPTTLEEMILQLELEEAIARKEKLNKINQVGREYGRGVITAGRMSCVNNSDILRSARNALNQYPRFSLDGRDAMYRSSFRNDWPDSISAARDNFIVAGSRRSSSETMKKNRLSNNFNSSRKHCLPPTLAGESVVWCKPGVVAKLMGLEAVPVPAAAESKGALLINSVMKRQNLRRRVERHETERRLATSTDHVTVNYCDGIKRSGRRPSCSKANAASTSCSTGYRVMNPAADDRDGWPVRRLR